MCEACSIESNQAPQGMAYAPGKPFPTHHAQNASDYLNAALAAERWIATFEHKTPEGIFWQQDASQPIDLSLYSGSAGVAYFYLKLAEVTGSAEFAEKARRGLSYAAAHWRDLLLPEQAAFQDNREGVPGVHLGAHMGVGGVGLVLIEGAKTFAESRDAEKYRRAAQAIGRFYTDESAQQGESGPYWTGSPALLMDGGIMLFLIALYEAFGDRQLLEFIKAAGAQYLHWGAESPRGGIDFNGAGIETPFDWPNFAFGSAGSGYLLAHLFRITGDARYLEVARRCADFLDAVAVPQKRGKLIPHKLGGDDEFTVFYLGYCHGIAGTLRFPTLMGTLDNDIRWATMVNQLADGAEALGAPEHMSAGLWNTVCYCCGHAGMAHTFLGLYCIDGSPRWRELATRCGDILLGSMKTHADGSASWPFAWERVHPEELSQRIGFYDGAAGIASTLLELFMLERDDYRWPRMIDDPFPEDPRR